MKPLRVIVLAVLSIGIVCIAGTPVAAESVRIQPLQYRTDLKRGEKKKGHVDIANPSGKAIDVKLYVSGFSQIDDKGSLTFFTNEQLSKGLLLDYDETRLEPWQTLRLYFLADGTKLPTGDVFATIFAETKPSQQVGAATAARVGTLVMIVNQTPGPRNAEIAALTSSMLQIGSSVNGTIAVKNPAKKGAATGYFPKIRIAISPWGGKTEYQGPLLFAGNTRTVDFAIPSNMFGLYTIKVTVNNAEKSTLVFLITGWWRFVVPVIILLLIGIIIVVKRHGLPRRKQVRFKKASH